MKKKIMTLQTKISIMITGVLFISISFILPFLVRWISNEIHNKVEINVMNTAEIVAKTPLIREKLLQKDTNGEIQVYIEELTKHLENIKFIVVADMNGTRYSHPNPSRIGEKFRGGDESRVLEKGETYISRGEGTLGISFRAFTPIYYEYKQIGFVSVGTLEESVNKSMKVATANLFLFAFIGFMIGTVGTVFLTASIKKSLLGLEPEEIAKLYNDKTGMLEAISEGIIAIDNNENITLINEAALKIIQLDNQYNKKDLLGKKILDYFDTTQLPNVLRNGEVEYDKEMIVNNTIILANRVPIKNNGKIVGAMATFRDKTEFTNLAEEVTGVKQIIEALRANTHEFSNKLHVILGLLHLKEIDEAKKYIKSVSENQEENLSLVTSRVKEPTIAGLLLGKISRAKELNIDLEINEDSYYINDTDINNHVFVTILGNLLENAFEAVSQTSNEEKIVYLKILETNKFIEIDIEDNGIGISNKKLEKIFERGYTTKKDSKGVGLDLVKRVVKSLNGEIKVNSDKGIGTYFNIIIPKNLKNIQGEKIMISVLIVEDDPMVSQLNKRYIESLDSFKVIGQAANGLEGLEFCSRKEVDLIILDVYMPKLDGVKFLKEMRKRKISADVILVTASKEIETVDEVLKMGAFDYLVKPFEYERLKKSLSNYLERHDILNEKEQLKQSELDKIFLGNSKVNSNIGIQKGLHKRTLDRVRNFLKENSKYYTSEEIAVELSLTKVTIRRYLEYLESTGEIKLEIEYGTVGRPTHLYKYI